MTRFTPKNVDGVATEVTRDKDAVSFAVVITDGPQFIVGRKVTVTIDSAIIDAAINRLAEAKAYHMLGHDASLALVAKVLCAHGQAAAHAAGLRSAQRFAA